MMVAVAPSKQIHHTLPLSRAVLFALLSLAFVQAAAQSCGGGATITDTDEPDEQSRYTNSNNSSNSSNSTTNNSTATTTTASSPVYTMSGSKNVLNETLELCGMSPLTGFHRDGFCETGPQDVGRHVVCSAVTREFLEFSRSRGNDLMTPAPRYGFPGLRAGDKWCLCAARWREAFAAGVAPPIVLPATHANALSFVSLSALESKALQ